MKLNIEGAKKTLRRTAFPTNVTIESIAKCNYGCQMCPILKLDRPRGAMSFEIFRKVADEIARENPATGLWFAYMGEPLLLGDGLIRLMEYAKQKGLTNTHLSTNASLLTLEMAHKVLASGVDEVILSMDADTEETYKQIRIGGVFQEVVENVEGILRLRNQMKATTRLIAQFVVMPENEGELEPFKQRWLRQGATVKVRPKLGWGLAYESECLTLPDSARDFPCPWLMRTTVIQWDGRYAQCDADFNAEFSPGNIQTQTIKQVWNGELAVRRERHWALDFDFEPCRNCKDWQAGLSEFHEPEEAIAAG